MVQLFLSEPVWSDDSDDDDDSSEQSISILKKLESVVWSLLTSAGRSESRLWLCNTISCSNSVTPQVQRELFVSLLKSKPTKVALATQVLQMIFERRPHKIGPIIAKKSHILEKFFEGNPRRISQWFDNFGESEHRKGARAISQFSFVNRDICWEELEWKGKHGQSPAVVATKPHYFLDLDVQRTVENFLENVPEFWSSDELSNSIEDGGILLIDTKFFVDSFIQLMYKENSKDVWEVVNEFFLEESFSLLCHHLLILLEEPELLGFLKTLRKFLTATMNTKCIGHPSYWLEILLFMLDDCASFDDLLLVNTVINQSRQLLRFVRDQEHKEQRGKIEKLISELSIISSLSHSSFMKKGMKTRKAEVVKLLGLHSWVLQYRMSDECETPESWEALFVKNGISFRKVDNFDLLPSDGSSEGSGSDPYDWSSTRSKRKKKTKSRKKRSRRRSSGCHGKGDDDLGHSDTLSVLKGVDSRDRSWLLSTDGYSSSWTKVDLPEHLAKHCFCTWMKWVCSQWSSLT